MLSKRTRRASRNWQLTLGETRTQETGNLLDQSVGGDKGIVLAGKLLDQFLILVKLLQVVGGHGVNTVVLGSIDIVLVTENTIHQPKSVTAVAVRSL